jgi:hypothetical protein
LQQKPTLCRSPTLDAAMALEDDPHLGDDRASLLGSPLGALFPELRRGVWHCTGPRGYAGIRNSRVIEPSTGKHPYTYPQTEASFARLKGYVSVFDFAVASDAQCFTMNFKWTRFFSHFEPFTAALELDRAKLGSRLIPASVARGPEASDTVWSPWVEAWHEGPIPLTAVRRYLIVPRRRVSESYWLAPEDPRHAELEHLALTNPI